MSAYPSGMSTLITALTGHGWNFRVIHNIDTGDHPFVTIESMKGAVSMMVTWHTRKTGTYRLFTCMINKRDTTLTAALKEVEATP